MALIVEDGTGLADAESYISVADTIAYLTKFGEDTETTFVAGNVTEQEQWLRQATRYLDTTYHQLWKGSRAHETQALDWPRIGVTDDDGFIIESTVVPIDLIDANAVMGGRAVADTLLSNDLSNGDIIRDKSKVGPLETDITFQSGVSQDNNYRKTRSMLLDLIKGGVGMFSERG